MKTEELDEELEDEEEEHEEESEEEDRFRCRMYTVLELTDMLKT